MHWLVTFDVSGDARRRVITTALRRRGFRIAYSVFVVRAGERELDAMLAYLADAVGDSGHLLALPCCADCEVHTTGMPLEREPADGWVVW